MTTHPTAAAATGLPESPPSTWAALNAIGATAGDIKHLIDVLSNEVSGLTAQADTANYGIICRTNAVARALETLCKEHEARCGEAYEAIRREDRL